MAVPVAAQSASPSVHPLPTHSNIVLSLEAACLVCQVGWVEPLELREVEPKVDLWVVSDRLRQRPYMEGGGSCAHTAAVAMVTVCMWCSTGTLAQLARKCLAGKPLLTGSEENTTCL